MSSSAPVATNIEKKSHKAAQKANKAVEKAAQKVADNAPTVDTTATTEAPVAQAAEVQAAAESTFDTTKKHIADKVHEVKEACDQYATELKRTVSNASEKYVKPLEEKRDAAIKYTTEKKAIVEEKVQDVRAYTAEKKAVVEEKVHDVRAYTAEKRAVVEKKVQNVRAYTSEKKAVVEEKVQNVRTIVVEKTIAAKDKALGAVEFMKCEPTEAGKVENTLVSVASFTGKTAIHIAALGLEALGMKEYTQKRLHSTNESIWKFVEEHPRITSTGNAFAAYWPVKIGHRVATRVSDNVFA